jgi:superfamily I DNA/RNA helicase
VLAVSLTRTAAAELRSRADAIPQENCATMHAHALRALEIDPSTLAETPAAMREFADASDIADGGSRRDLDDLGDSAAPSLHVAVTNHRARLTPPADWTDDERAYSAAWEDWKTQTRRVDFTDMIQACIAEHVPPLNHPRVILADEAQDFTALEFQLLMTWAADAESTVCVGDSQQCIYWFRGADPDRLDALPVAHNETLKQSWRVPRAVHAVAGRWAAQLPGPAVDWCPRDTQGHVEEAVFALRDTPHVADLAQVMGRHGTTMVLASCRYMLAPLCAELRERGIAYHNPWRAEETQWNPLQGPGAVAVRALMAPVTDGRFWTWGDLLDLTAVMRADALARGSKAAIEEHCRRDEFDVSRAGETVPFDTLLTLLGMEDRRFVDHPMLGIDLSSSRDVALDWLRDSLLARASKSTRYALDVVRGGGSLTDEPRLVVGTVHSVKGGEADHVILAPELSKEGYWQAWCGGGAARDAIVRAYYVALTRARETVTLLEPGCPEYAPVSDVLRERTTA